VLTKLRCRFIGLSVIAGLVALLVLPLRPSYSGELESERDEVVPLAFVGSARETGTLAPIPDVQITATMDNRKLMVRTNGQGIYKLTPYFGIDVPPESVTVSCTKDGYETVDVSRRQISSAAANVLIVAECLLAPKH
jgi:hypothetical protein